MMVKPKIWLCQRKNPSGRKTWIIRWRDPVSLRMRQEVIGPDKDRARERFSDKRKELREGIDGGIVVKPWSDFGLEVVEHLRAVRSSRTADDVAHTLAEFGKLCDPRFVHAVTLPMVKSYVRKLRQRGSEGPCDSKKKMNQKNKRCDRQLSAASVNKRLRNLRWVLNVAKGDGYIKANPLTGNVFQGVALMETKKPIRWIHPEWADTMLDEAAKLEADALVWQTFIAFAQATGQRLGDLLARSWDDIDLKRRRVYFTIQKTHEECWLPIVDERAIDLLQRLYDASPKRVESGRAVPKDAYLFEALAPCRKPNRFRYRRWHLIRKAADVPYCTPHDFRRARATLAAAAGINQKVAQELLRHRSASTTSKYYQAVSEGTMRAALTKIAAG